MAAIIKGVKWSTGTGRIGVSERAVCPSVAPCHEDSISNCIQIRSARIRLDKVGLRVTGVGEVPELHVHKIAIVPITHFIDSATDVVTV